MSDAALLLDGAVDAWLAEVDDALARLLTSGLAHPDAELPAALALLAERAERLGAATAAAGLSALARATDALRPGPPDLATRTALAAGAWDEVMRLVAWLRLFRDDLNLTAAGARAAGAERAPVVDDTPRFTGRVWVDGLTLSAEDRLVIVARTADGEPVLLFDPLAEVRREDPFGHPVISRLLQDVVELGRVARAAFDLDGHPCARRGDAILVQPAFRAVPRWVATDGPGPPSRACERVRVRVAASPEGPTARAVDGRAVQVGKILRYSLLKLLSVAGSPAEFTADVLPRQDGLVVLAAELDGERSFPAVDARAWALDPRTLADRLAGADLWARCAAALHGGAPDAALSALDAELEAWTGPVDTRWRLAWASARLGLAGPRAPEPGAAPPSAFGAIWGALWEGGDPPALAAAWERMAELPDPSPDEVAGRALLLDHRGDREAALAYLDAHLAAYARRAKVEQVLPPAGHLLALADARAWLTGADRSGPIADALGLPAVALRERAAAALLAWRLGEGPPSADELALASASSWGPTWMGG